MSFIEISGLNKTFKVQTKNSGLKSSIKAVFKREYKKVEAVKNVSFSIEQGEIVGLLGPNGAGKSTTIKMLTGILTPDSGIISIGGKNPYKDRINFVKDIGVVFGQRSQLWWDIPAEDTFDLLKSIYKIDKKEYEKNKDELVKLLKLESIIKRPVRQLSLGERMRCEIVASLLHNPSILFLDEPTIGLDALSKQIVRDFIKKINKEKKVTIILTTHDMADIESLSKRIIMIAKGEKLYDGTLRELKNKYNETKINIKTKSRTKINNKKIIKQEKIKEGYSFTINCKVSEFIKIITNKIEIDDMDIEEQNLDSVLVKLYEEVI